MVGIKLPKVIFGTSGLGNLYVTLSDADKCAIVKECVQHSTIPAVFDTAGKYGAGLALESLGKCLKQLGIKPENVLISNKLGWYRIPLTTPEPTFEPGVWKDLQYDAEQRISYEGILQCFEQGNELLNGYHTELISVHGIAISKPQIEETNKEKLRRDVHQRAGDALRKELLKESQRGGFAAHRGAIISNLAMDRAG